MENEAQEIFEFVQNPKGKQELTIVDEREVLGKQFRIYGNFENPLFLASDVANWIEHSQPSKMLQNIDDDEKLRGTLFLSGQRRDYLFLTEDGMYEVLMQSRKPIAKQFKKQVKEILRTIRNTGGYISNEETFINTYLPNADEQTKIMIKSNLETIRSLNNQIEQDKPKVLFANAVETAHTSILVGELAKLLRQNGVQMGQNRLFDWLRAEGYLIKGGSSKNMPTQYAMERGLFEVMERTVSNPDGSVRITKTPKVTGKGQIYFIKKLTEVAI